MQNGFLFVHILIVGSMHFDQTFMVGACSGVYASAI